MPIERLESVAVVDLHVIAETAVTPPRVLDDSAVCSQERRIRVRRKVDAVMEVATDRRIPGLEPIGAATKRLGEDPGLERVLEHARGHTGYRHFRRDVSGGEILTGLIGAGEVPAADEARD